MKPVLIIAALSLGACAPQTGGAPGDTAKGSDGSYNGPGAKYVTQEQADWLARTHARPAGGN